MKTCECGSDIWRYDNKFWCAICGTEGVGHFFCVHCGAEFREATGELLQKHIRECPEHPLPKITAELAKVRAEADELRKECHLLRGLVQEAHLSLAPLVEKLGKIPPEKGTQSDTWGLFHAADILLQATRLKRGAKEMTDAEYAEAYSLKNVKTQLQGMIRSISVVNKILRRVDKGNRADQLWCCICIIEGVLEELETEHWPEERSQDNE